MEYDASAIKVLDPFEAKQRFQYVTEESLLEKYPSISKVFIHRLLAAANQVNESPWPAIKRYLDKDQSVSVSSEFREAFLVLADQRAR